MARKFSNTFEVCTCRHVTLAEVVYAIKEKNAKTLDDLAIFTDAGTCCKSCKNPQSDMGVEKKELYLEEILDKLTKMK